MASQKYYKISNCFLNFHKKEKELQKKKLLGTILKTQEGLQETLDKKRGLLILTGSFFFTWKCKSTLHSLLSKIIGIYNILANAKAWITMMLIQHWTFAQIL